MTLSSHVLDAVRGTPARGVGVRWERRSGSGWDAVARAVTDDDGRISAWEAPTTAGVHRLVFDTGGYFAAEGRSTFYPEVVVVFEIAHPEAHHHVPLLLSPFSYTTYRGS